MPKENLRIEGAEQQYGVDEMINVTCKSGESMPAPNITWFINDNLVGSMYIFMRVCKWHELVTITCINTEFKSHSEKRSFIK